MTRLIARTCGLTALSLALSVPASAQVVQSIQFGAGGFFPRGFDARVPGDVLVEDLSNANPLLFLISDLRSGQVFGEYTLGFGDHVELGFGAGIYSGHAPSIYRDLVNTDRTEITQDLHLRIVPFTAVVRFLPVGRPGSVQPYVGAGVSALRFRYSESGSFVDTSDLSVFTARFTATGTAPGFVALGGVRVPIRGDIFAFNLEGRYQVGTGNTGGDANGFLDDKIDLSGGSANFGFLVRF